MRLYATEAERAVVADAHIVTMCPYRFGGSSLREWISETMLGSLDTHQVTEVPFLHRVSRTRTVPEETDDEAPDADETALGRPVGKIDNILIHPDLERFDWCALEIQAVYFQGPGMSDEWKGIDLAQGEVHFPKRSRRPDFRSSGPKRLMPQLQVKVPTLRRWGKKMAVLIDEPFYNALAPMSPVGHLSNADIAWFVAKYELDADNEIALVPGEVLYTTLEASVEGLTAGRPLALPEFEAAIRAKLPPYAT